MNTVTIQQFKRNPYVTLRFSYWIIVLSILGLIAINTENTTLTFFSLALVPVLIALLWRVGEPPILFLAVFSQWTQAVVKLLDANLRGLSLQDYHGSWTIDEAVWLNLLALLILAVGIRVALSGLKQKNLGFIEEIQNLSIKKVWYAYLILFTISLVVEDYVWVLRGLSQPLLMALAFKWALYFILGMAIFGQRREMHLLVIATLMEVLLGISGFFSGFHQVFVLLLLVSATYIKTYSWKLVIFSTAVVLVLVFMWILWSAVKAEYREYLNQGTGRQVVLVSWSDRVSKISEISSDINQEDFLNGVEGFAKRVSYVDYFARVLETVPEYIPHADGEIWGGSIKHVLTPRLLFPDKEVLVSDTLVTDRYTQLNLIEQAGTNTTVPLGYLAESYIDFGRVFMFIPIFIVGVSLGLIYRFFLGAGHQSLFGFAVTAVVLLQAHKLEIGSTKLVGGVLMAFIVMALIRKFFVPVLHKTLSMH